MDAFYRAGSLVFGGGHVVLPLLQAEVVPSGWVGIETFLAGYGAAQAVPGPLFTFAAFLGASMNESPTGWMGGVLCLLSVFLPSFLLVAGALPFWEQVRRNIRVQVALSGANSAVVWVVAGSSLSAGVDKCHPSAFGFWAGPHGTGRAYVLETASVARRHCLWGGGMVSRLTTNSCGVIILIKHQTSGV